MSTTYGNAFKHTTLQHFGYIVALANKMLARRVCNNNCLVYTPPFSRYNTGTIASSNRAPPGVIRLFAWSVATSYWMCSRCSRRGWQSTWEGCTWAGMVQRTYSTPNSLYLSIYLSIYPSIGSRTAARTPQAKTISGQNSGKVLTIRTHIGVIKFRLHHASRLVNPHYNFHCRG